MQEAWDQAEGPHTWFKIGFGGQLLHGVDTGYRVGILVQAIVTVVALVAVPFVARRFGAAYGAYTLFAVGLAALATKDFQGMGRYMLGAFPLFALAGTLLAGATACVRAGARRRRARSSWSARSGSRATGISRDRRRGDRLPVARTHPSRSAPGSTPRSDGAPARFARSPTRCRAAARSSTPAAVMAS